ncbi:hypothetical protein OROHE_013675 [Orobanche hederae]
METGNKIVCHKRKMEEIYVDEFSKFPLNELNQDLLERVLSRLPASSFFRLTPVCKRWKSVTDSPTFELACSEIPSRDPWFFMVRSQPHTAHQATVIFDSAGKNWKKLKNPLLPNPNHDPPTNFIPVAAAGGLICFHRAASDGGGDLIIANPITASSRQVPNPQAPILAIAMVSKFENFKLVSVSGELPNLTFGQYNSITDQWEESIVLTRKTDGPGKPTTIDDDDCTHYFLSKCGNVVSTDIQRSPSKQFSSFLTVKAGEEVLSFLSSSGTIVSCNLTHGFFFEYPRILPVSSEYSIDLVEIGGEIYIVLLSEFLESAGLRVWTWDDRIQTWRQVAAMPPCMSHEFFGKKADINCTGSDRQMLVCVNYDDIFRYVMCDLVANEWVELPECSGGNDFVSALSFEPRIEASVSRK